MFLKQKHDNTVKGRGCANGTKQRNHYDKEDAASPTVALESLLLTSVVDAHKQQDVVVVDILGDFLQADLDNNV